MHIFKDDFKQDEKGPPALHIYPDI